jgi:hypothetical protein
MQRCKDQVSWAEMAVTKDKLAKRKAKTNACNAVLEVLNFMFLVVMKMSGNVRGYSSFLLINSINVHLFWIKDKEAVSNSVEQDNAVAYFPTDCYCPLPT